MLENEDFLKILEHAYSTSQETARTLHEENTLILNKVESQHCDSVKQQETSGKQFDECARRTKHLRVETEEKQRMIDALTADNEQLKTLCEDQALLNTKLLEEVQGAIEHQKSKFAKAEIVQKQNIEEISRAQRIIDLCDKYLGLQIRVLGHKEMQFLFKNIIPEKPDAVAYINLTLNDQKDYRILETYPSLPELIKLEGALNKTNNLSGFIQCSRRLLKNEWMKSI